MKVSFIIIFISAVVISCQNWQAGLPEYSFVKNGEVSDAILSGKSWTSSSGHMTGSGLNNYLVAGKTLAEGDFRIHIRLRLDSLNFSGASLMIGGNHFGFDAKSGDGRSALFVEGPLLGKISTVSGTEGLIKAGIPFDAGVELTGNELSFLVNGETVFSQPLTGSLKGNLALRPRRNTMQVATFSASGNLLPVNRLTWLFESGDAGYNTFRIPAIVTSSKGTLLAFAEGRKNSTSDTGDIDLVMKRSDDSGKTWSDLIVIWDDSTNVCGNPAPVVDKTTGTIFLLSTWNLGTDREPDIINQTSKDTRRIFLLYSADDGKTWSLPKEITGSVKKPEWTWYATGPCHGIQTQKGSFNGRLIIPCDHIEAGTKKYFSHIIFSDDHGKTWNLGGTTPQDQVNECTVAELSGGRLMLNMRNYDRTQKSRKVSVSENGGITWNDIYADNTLIEPICQGSLLTHTFADSGSGKMLFLNPADENQRINMTLRLSADEGKSWTESLVLHPGPSAYSDMTLLPGGDIGCLYEAGYVSPYEGILYREISIRFQPPDSNP